MNLIETTALTSADFPIAEFRDYLRLGSGFTDDGAQDVVLETCLRAAMGAIEARTSKALISRIFDWSFSAYRLENGALILPISPVRRLQFFNLLAQDGTVTPVPRTDYIFQNDLQRQRLMSITGVYPDIPSGGTALLKLLAGFGTWSNIPPAMQQAMLMLAASYYENRDAMLNGGGQMPLAVATLLAPYQRIRLGGGI